MHCSKEQLIILTAARACDGAITDRQSRYSTTWRPACAQEEDRGVPMAGHSRAFSDEVPLLLPVHTERVIIIGVINLLMIKWLAIGNLFTQFLRMGLDTRQKKFYPSYSLGHYPTLFWQQVISNPGVGAPPFGIWFRSANPHRCLPHRHRLEVRLHDEKRSTTTSAKSKEVILSTLKLHPSSKAEKPENYRSTKTPLEAHGGPAPY